MGKLKPSLLVALMAILTGCGDGTTPTALSTQKPSNNVAPNDGLEWTFGETVPLTISGSRAKRTIQDLGQNLGLNVNQFENLSVNLELQSISVINPGGQQYFEGDLSIGWTSDGEFQEIRASAETDMMQVASLTNCSWWRACTIMFNADNEARKHSYGRGTSVRLIFEILDEWGADYDKLGGAFIFYGHERGDDGTMEGSIHYLPRYCPNGGGYVNGRFYACGGKSMNAHCWLKKAGPYQCHTETLKPAAGSNTYVVQHCKNAKWNKKQNKYVCPTKERVTRHYTRIGSFTNFDITNANSDYYGSISTSDNSRSLASVGENNQLQIIMLYILFSTFICTIIVTLIGYSKSMGTKNEKKV